MRITERVLKIGNRVRVVSYHRWLPEREGIIKRVENRIGNRFLVKFDRDELGMWHDEDGDPMLRLGEDDLVFIEEGLSLAA
jgi:nuclear transport factor 2 (NTF2) superfamily protein